MLSIRNVSKAYPSLSKAEKFAVAIEEVSLDIRQSEFIVLLGPSGCGKSTLLRIIASMEDPSTGMVSLDGGVIRQNKAEAIMVWQDFGLLEWRNVQRNVELGLEIKGIEKKRRTEIASHFIDLVGLKKYAKYYPSEISGGMKQRVALARSLAVEPKILLMDEPFGALDAQTRLLMQEELLRIREKTGATIVFVTHSIDEAILLGDRIAVFTAAPGKIKEVIDVHLPRPRTPDMRSDPEFQKLHHHLYILLRQEVLKASNDGHDLR